MALIRKTRVTGAILLGLLAAPVAHALSIGETLLHSYLMQPLDAEIRLHGADQTTAGDLKVRVGDTADFERLGIAWANFPARLKLAVEQRNGKWVIHATTRDPIQQPYLQFPLRIRSGRIRLIKEITLLLDPPGHTTVKPARAPTEARNDHTIPRTAVSAATPTGRTYRVKPGDTLWPIADTLRPGNVTNYQMMIALQRANPNAFQDGNINKLLSGSLLNVPSAEQARQISHRDALTEFRRQTRTWKSKATAAPATRLPAPSQAAPTAEIPSGQGTGVPANTRKTEAGETTAEPRLEVLPPPDEAASEAPPTADREVVQQEILLNEEKVRSQELEQTNIRQQIANLQAQMDQMQTLLKLKDQQIAALQSIIETRKLAARGQTPAAETPDLAIEAETAPRQPPTASKAPPSAQEVPAAKPAPVTVVTDRLPRKDESTTEDSLTIPTNWLWALLGGTLFLLLVLLLKRRSSERSPRGDLPLAAYPEVAHSTPKPYTDTAQHAEHESEVPVMPEPTPAPLTEAPVAEAPATEPPSPSTPPMEDVDLLLTEEGELPDLDEHLLAGETPPEEAAAESGDKVAAFWEQLDIPEIQDPETPSAQAGDEDQSLEILLEMARAYVELGDQEEAVGILQQALASAEDEEKRERIQQALEEIS